MCVTNRTLKSELIRAWRKENSQFAIVDKELTELWLEQLNKTTDVQVNVDLSTAKFIWNSCQELKVERDVFFMALEILELYKSKLRDGGKKLPKPMLVFVTVILISSKSTGLRETLTINAIISYLHELSISTYFGLDVEVCEWEILTKINFQIPSFTLLDDMLILIENFVKPKIFTMILRDQCITALEITYLNLSKVNDLLDRIYEKHEMSQKIQEYKKKKLFIPTCVVLCVIKICEELKIMVISDEIGREMSKFVKIPFGDLKVLAKVIYELIALKIFDNFCKT